MLCFFFNDTATTEIYTLSLHDALPIYLLHSLLDELQEGPGKVFMPLRAVMTGQARGADLYNVLHVIGKERAIQRIQTMRSEEHTSELQSRQYLVCCLLLEKTKIYASSS